MSARLDGARFRHELRVRGVTAGAVAKVARVSPNTLTRCIAGAPIRESTLREVIRALMSLPVMRGSELVAPETTKTPSVELDVLNGENGVAATTRRL
jgi:predicted transcriptional regulator